MQAFKKYPAHQQFVEEIWRILEFRHKKEAMDQALQLPWGSTCSSLVAIIIVKAWVFVSPASSVSISTFLNLNDIISCVYTYVCACEYPCVQFSFYHFIFSFISQERKIKQITFLKAKKKLPKPFSPFLLFLSSALPLYLVWALGTTTVSSVGNIQYNV